MHRAGVTRRRARAMATSARDVGARDDSRDAVTAFASAGAASLASAVYFWRKRATMPFKISAAATWLTAGPAAVLWCAPSRASLERELAEKAAARGASAREDAIRRDGVAAARTLLEKRASEES